MRGDHRVIPYNFNGTDGITIREHMALEITKSLLEGYSFTTSEVPEIAVIMADNLLRQLDMKMTDADG